jgi:hypothetical protein
MSKPVEVDIALGILDHQLVDSDGVNCGKVDDLEVQGLAGGSPEVTEIIVGGNAWRSRGFSAGSPPASRAMRCTCPGRRSSRSAPWCS